MPDFDQKSATTTSSSAAQQQQKPGLLFFPPRRVQNLFEPMSTKAMIQKSLDAESEVRAWLDKHQAEVRDKHENGILLRVKKEVPGLFIVLDTWIRDVIRQWSKDRKVPIVQTLDTKPIPAPSSSGGGLDLGKLLNIEFNAGQVKFSISIPESATINWPIKFKGGQTITLSLGHEVAGKSSFSVKGAGLLKGFDVKLTASGQAYGENQGRLTFSLTFISTKKTCSVNRTDLAGMQEKSAAIMKALDNYQNPEKAKKTPDEETPSQTSLLFKLGGAIGDFYKALDENEKKCSDAMRPSFEIGPQIFVDPKTGDVGGGAGATWRF